MGALAGVEVAFQYSIAKYNVYEPGAASFGTARWISNVRLALV
jgi:hypothetical protein